MVDRVCVTQAAEAVIAKLRAAHGPLLFHQSGGCCDGSAPMCYPLGEFRVGAQDVFLGRIANVPFYIGAAQFVYWSHTQLIIDVVQGRGSGFSLEGARRCAFPHPQPRLHRRRGRGAGKSGAAADWRRRLRSSP